MEFPKINHSDRGLPLTKDTAYDSVEELDAVVNLLACSVIRLMKLNVPSENHDEFLTLFSKILKEKKDAK